MEFNTKRLEQIDWDSAESFVFLNPRLPDFEKEQLKNLTSHFPQAGHVWICSSGSSNAADESVKLIALSKSAILVAAKSVNSFLQSSKSDNWLNPLPIFHIGGLSIFARAFLSGAMVTDFSNEKWSAVLFVEKIQSKKITLTSLVPTQVYDLVQAGLPCPKSLRAVLVGGAALSPELYLQARNLGWPLLPSFGMTETSAVMACAELQSLAEKKFPRLQVLSHVQVQLNDEKKLMVRGDSLLTGFAQMKKNETVWSQVLMNGWLQTDDFAQIDVLDGQTYLQPLGRGQDFIKIKGEGVNLALLRLKFEEFLAKNFAEYQQKIILSSRPHSRDLNELIFICEKSVPEQIIRSLQERFNHSVMPYERILQIHSVHEIPRTPLRKIIWSQLV